MGVKCPDQKKRKERGLKREREEKRKRDAAADVIEQQQFSIGCVCTLGAHQCFPSVNVLFGQIKKDYAAAHNGKKSSKRSHLESSFSSRLIISKERERERERERENK